jgi:hypothetical protein
MRRAGEHVLGVDCATGSVRGLLQGAHAHMKSEEYDKARAPLLQAIGSRDDINEPETISYILTSLGSTWLLTEPYGDGIAFFSKYIDRRYSEGNGPTRIVGSP